MNLFIRYFLSVLVLASLAGSAASSNKKNLEKLAGALELLTNKLSSGETVTQALENFIVKQDPENAEKFQLSLISAKPEDLINAIQKINEQDQPALYQPVARTKNKELFTKLINSEGVKKIKAQEGIKILVNLAADEQVEKPQVQEAFEKFKGNFAQIEADENPFSYIIKTLPATIKNKEQQDLTVKIAEDLINEIEKAPARLIMKHNLLHNFLDALEPVKIEPNSDQEKIIVNLWENIIEKNPTINFDEKYQGGKIEAKNKTIKERLEGAINDNNPLAQKLISKIRALKKVKDSDAIRKDFVEKQINFFTEYYDSIKNEPGVAFGEAKNNLSFIKGLHENVKDNIWPIKQQHRTSAQESLTYLIKNQGKLAKSNNKFVLAALRLLVRIDSDLINQAVEFEKKLGKFYAKAESKGYLLMDEMFDWANNIVEFYLEDINKGRLTSNKDDRAADLGRALRYIHLIWPYLEEALIEAAKDDPEAQKFTKNISKKILYLIELLKSNEKLLKKLNIESNWLIVSLEDILREQHRVFCLSGWKVVNKIITAADDFINPLSGDYKPIDNVYGRFHKTFENRKPSLVIRYQKDKNFKSFTGDFKPGDFSDCYASLEDCRLPKEQLDRIDAIIQEDKLYYQSFKLDITIALCLIEKLKNEKNEDKKLFMEQQIITSINKFVGYILDRTGIVCPVCLSENLKGQKVFTNNEITSNDLTPIENFINGQDQNNRFVKKAAIGIKIIQKILASNNEALLADEAGKKTLKIKETELLEKINQNVKPIQELKFDSFLLADSEYVSWTDPLAEEWRQL